MTRLEVRAETEAHVHQVGCAAGERVAAGHELVVLESMKMEIPVDAPAGGAVLEVRVVVGARVVAGDVLVVLVVD